MKRSQNSYFMVEWAKESSLFQSRLFRVATVILKSLVTYINFLVNNSFCSYCAQRYTYRVLQTIQMKGSPVKSHVYLLSMYLKSMSQKSIYSHFSISSVSISAIFDLPQFIILSYFPPL